MIELKDFSLTRGDKDLISNLNFQFKAGKCYGLVGANGSGKSSLLAAIAGDLPYQGEINYLGRELSNLEFGEFNRYRAVLLQDLTIEYPITVNEFLELAGSNTLEEVDKALSDVGALDLKNELITTLSKGQSQRVQIAATFIQNSSVFLLDEPFSAQDNESVKRLSKLFKNLAKNGKTLIIASHINTPKSLFYGILNLASTGKKSRRARK